MDCFKGKTGSGKSPYCNHDIEICQCDTFGWYCSAWPMSLLARFGISSCLSGLQCSFWVDIAGTIIYMKAETSPYTLPLEWSCIHTIINSLYCPITMMIDLLFIASWPQPSFSVSSRGTCALCLCNSDCLILWVATKVPAHCYYMSYRHEKEKQIAMLCRNGLFLCRIQLNMR